MLLLCIIFLLVTDFGKPKWELTVLLNNLFIIPLNYPMFLESKILTTPHWSLLPPAWSLGLELQAYILLPFVVFYRKSKMTLAGISLIVFFAANFNLLDTSLFGYRLLPGVFFIFILGSCIYKNVRSPQTADGFDRLFPKIALMLCAFGVVGVYLDGGMHRLFAIEVLFGTMISIPIVTFCARSRLKLPFDRLLGEMSYGIFLSHWLGIWVFHFLFPSSEVRTIEGLGFVLGFSSIATLAGIYLVENRFVRLRYQFTKTNPN